MVFRELPLAGAYLIEIAPHVDERGFFSRTFCVDEFGALGLETRVAQSSVSYNRRRGTLRGLHFQRAPHEEERLVRCTSGAIFDVLVDVRQGSSTRGRWHGVTLSASERNQLWVPKGFAHGFLTLTDEVEVTYQMTVPFAPGSAAGYRYDDPTFAIAWPFEPEVVSQRDLELPWFAP